MDDIDDIEEEFKRRRDARRQRQKEEFKRRREARSSSSSSSSGTGGGYSSLTNRSDAASTNQLKQSSVDRLDGGTYIATAVTTSRDNTDITNEQSTPKKKRFKWQASDSSDDDNLEQVAKRLAEKQNLKAAASPNPNNTSSTAPATSFKKTGFQFSDSSDSEDDLAKTLTRIKQRNKLAKAKTAGQSINQSASGAAAQAVNGSIDYDCTPKTSNRSPLQRRSTAFGEKDVLPKLLGEKMTGLNVEPLTSLDATAASCDLSLLQPKKQYIAKPLEEGVIATTTEQAKPVERSDLEDNVGDIYTTTFKPKSASEAEVVSVGNPSVPSAASFSTLPTAASNKAPTTTTASPTFASDQDANNSNPIIATSVQTPPNVRWSVHKQCLIVRNSDFPPRDKVAGYDLDQTLVHWTCAGWPSRPEHYELWSASVIPLLQKCHDDGYKLVIFSNQGGIRGAFDGKASKRVKGIIDWIAKLVDRPLFAVCSTKKDSGYHKGNAGMWCIMEELCNGGKQVGQSGQSFFVGDSDGTGDNASDPEQKKYQQEGIDKTFAEKVGFLRGTTIQYYPPTEYFGLSNADRRRTMATVAPHPPLSKEVISARAALLGGYVQGPILLILCGCQGSGKSTFCQSLIEDNSSSWSHFSQDTIRGGKPGKREAVEDATKSALQNGKNVVVDRMHLESEQRSHFVLLGKECQVPVHALVMIATKEEVKERVTKRENHPGNVSGESGARVAVASFSKMEPPSYAEGFALISYNHELKSRMLDAYRCVATGNARGVTNKTVARSIELFNADNMSLPVVTMGTMGIGKRITSSIVSRALELGISSFDTAPTYNNEEEVGMALKDVSSDEIVIIKVPKRCVNASEAREEVRKSIKSLGRADVVLLHWPCDFIEANSLHSVWKELEAMKREGLCQALGVCNFNISALKLLIANCTVKPAINQVERHPLLPQYDLLEYW